MNQDNSTTIVKFSKMEYLLFFLAVFSAVLPAGAQSSVSFLILLWWFRLKGWRVALGGEGQHGWWRDFSKYCPSWHRLLLGTVVLGGMSVCAVVGQRLFGPLDFSDFGKAIVSLIRLIGKQGLYGCAMITAFMAASKRGWRFESIQKPLAIILVIYCLYMLLQRYFGFDWLHGFHAKIGNNRFADGIYRPSGFTSHPLSLAYATLSLGLVAAARTLFNTDAPARVRCWDGVLAGLFFSIIVLSATRWVMAVFILIVLGAGLPFLRKYWIRVLAFATFIVAMLIFEQSLIKRFMEPFLIDGELGQRFPRLVFWQVHAKLFADWPWFGAGFPMKESALMQHYIDYGFGSAMEKYNAHNIFLQQLADLGLVGFIGFLAFMGAHFVAARQLLPGWQRTAFFMLIWSGLIGGLMQNSFRDHEYMYVWWLAISLVISSNSLSCAKRNY